MRRAAYPVIFLAFLACYFATSPEYAGDTTRYAEDVIAHAEGREAQYWEFGHLLWRPWGYVGYSLLGHWYAQWFGDSPAQAVIRFLIQTNFVCSATVLLLLLFLARKVAGAWVAGAVVLAASCSASFLNYSHSGTPYIPALLFSAIALWSLTTAARSAKGGRRYAVLSGVSFAISCALWFPYSFTGLGMIAAVYLWPSRDSEMEKKEGRPDKHRLALIGIFLLSLAVSSLLLFAGGAAGKGIGNGSQLSQWIVESDNGWMQSGTAMRAITGVTRSVWNLGGDTVLLKRWLFSDPYNHVRILTLGFNLGGKLAAFYLGLAAVVWVLWREHRAMLLMLIAAGLPLLLFAIVLFEPSSPERFMPAFPFVCLAFATALERARRHVISTLCIAALLAGFSVLNLTANSGGRADSRLTDTRQRVSALNSQVRPGALVMVATFNDDLYRLPAARPLDRSLASSQFHVADVVALAERRTPCWRSTFAERAEAQWAQNREVWLSERVFARRPEAHWLWVEGDDRRVRWDQLPAAFGQLQTDLKVEAGGDDFRRVAQSQANRDLLAKWAAEGESAR